MRAPFDLRQRGRVMRVDLKPGEVGGRHCLSDAFEAFRLEVKVNVKMDAHVGANRAPDRHQLFSDAAGEPVVPVQFRPARGAAKSRHERRQSAIGVRHDVGLQCAETKIFDLLRVTREIIVAGQGGHAHQRRAPHAVGAEM